MIKMQYLLKTKNESTTDIQEEFFFSDEEAN